MSEQGIIDLAEIHEDLHERFTPHDGQIPIGQAIFYYLFKFLFICCGRSFGKSRIAAYILVRIARENPNTTNYCFGPFIGQMKEIYWEPGLIHNLIPPDEIDSINNSEMRITLKNGSFIRICGAENFEAFRGVKLNPKSICVIEEAKDIRKQFLDAFLPNLSVNDPILMMIGTPPYQHNHFIDYMNVAKKDPDWFYFNAPTETNPHVSRKYLENQKKILLEMGMEDVWLSEYMAQFTLGGHRAVFPMVPKMPIHKLEEVWPKDSNKWVLYILCDPASTSVFAVEFFLFNPTTQMVIPVGEIYESVPAQMTAVNINASIDSKIKDITGIGKVKEVNYVHDSAAAWFANEMSGVDSSKWFEPADKSSGLQGEISNWRGVLAHGHFIWTDAVPKLRWEMENCILNEKGKLPDKDDHAWQAGAYGLKSMGFDFNTVLEPNKPEKRFTTPEEEIGIGQNTYRGFDE